MSVYVVISRRPGEAVASRLTFAPRSTDNMVMIYSTLLFISVTSLHYRAHALHYPLNVSPRICVCLLFPFQSIDPSQQFTWEHSNLEVNKPKNRYANVIAYDHTRVILAPIDGKRGGGVFRDTAVGDGNSGGVAGG